MAILTLRVDDRDEKLFRDYAKMNGITVSELLRRSALERIEDELDLAAFDAALAAMKRTHSLSEVKESLGLADGT